MTAENPFLWESAIIIIWQFGPLKFDEDRDTAVMSGFVKVHAKSETGVHGSSSVGGGDIGIG